MTLLAISIVGRPDARSDEAVARVFAQWLERQHPGTVWQVTTPTASSDGGQR